MKGLVKTEIGVMASGKPEGENTFVNVAGFGLRAAQFVCWNAAFWTKENAARLKKDARTAGVRISAVWAGYSGRSVWNFTEGPGTLGLVPLKYRARRIVELKLAAEFAAACGAPAIVTHCGFIPENPSDRNYPGTLDAIGQIAEHCRREGVGFWFETGQETPVTLLRVIEDIGLRNMGINLDTANLILYGKANPLDSLDVFGKHVKCLHAKDGCYPKDGRNLGKEVPIGTGKVDFPGIFRHLKELGFNGDIVIEREIHGPQQAKDIGKSLKYLRRLLDKTRSA